MMIVPVDDLTALLAESNSGLDYQLFKQTDQLDSILRKVAPATASPTLYCTIPVSGA